MRSRGFVIAAVVVFSLVAVVVPARAGDSDMRIQFGVLYGTATDDLTDMGQTVELDDALGFQVSFEYQFTDLIGLEPAISNTNTDVTVKESGFPDLDLGEIDFTTLTFNLNFHLLGESRTDLFVGPTVGYAFWGDLKSVVFQDNFETDDQFIYGINIGVNVPFGESSWMFSGALNYLIAEAAVTGGIPGADLGYNPLQVKVGVSYSF